MMAGSPSGATERVIHEHGPGNTDRLGNRQSRGEAHGGNTTRFELTCDQTDRLMADGSNRHKQCNVAALLDDPSNELRREFVSATSS